MRWLISFVATLALAACDLANLNPDHVRWDPPGASAVSAEIRGREACADRDPQKRALFGDLHVHTGFSMDARGRDVTNGPDDAYRYARGEEIRVAPLGTDGLGRSFRIDRPLDFAAVTDHAEWLGEVALCTTPGTEVYATNDCRIFRGEETSWLAWALGLRGWSTKLMGIVSLSGRNTAVCGENNERCRIAMKSRWHETRAAAEEFYDRSEACRFTTLVAWEYSRSPSRTKIHRNVIFRNEIVPELPISWIDAETEVQLWEELHRTCLDTGTGCDVITVPHNPNLSNGNVFTLDYKELPLDEQRERVALRAGIEPLVEMMQIKGESECQAGLWKVLGADEFCGFEKMRGIGEQAPDNCIGDERALGGMANKGCVQRLDYVRYAVIEGMREEARLGINPFQVGFIGSTDTHNASPGVVTERTFPGTSGTMGATIKKRLGGTGADASSGVIPKGVRRNPGGLAGVWAEENSRDAIFDALQRREAFATSGPRIKPRLFAGWALPDDLCAASDMIAQGYAKGVAMGATLPPAPAGGAAPTFVVSALADAGTSEDPGGLLQRLQIVKGWYGTDDEFHQRIFDIAGSAAGGARVNLATCAVSGPGHAELCGSWRDPDFDPTRRAVYYARILENPSCRWSTWQCLRLPTAERPAACTDPAIAKTIQERAWTSPIWYTPPEPL